MSASGQPLPAAAPVLSTPDTHIFDPYKPAVPPSHSALSDEALWVRYQIEWTIDEIRSRSWRRIALQFPDQMLPDGPRVFELLRDGLRKSPRRAEEEEKKKSAPEQLEHEIRSIDVSDKRRSVFMEEKGTAVAATQGTRDSTGEVEEDSLYILGDTSYGACCVDEIAAEHVSADVVVHYGRACLSPTARLPVIHAFTVQPLDVDAVLSVFEATYPEKDSKVLLMADVTFSSYVSAISASLVERGYTSVFATQVVHNPSSLIPNRTVPPDLTESLAGEDDDDGAGSPLADWHLFHISNPPSALLLTLVSRVASIRIYPTSAMPSGPTVTTAASTELAAPMPLLRRRYGLLTRVRTAAIIGILVNTLSASSTLPMLARLRRLIADAGKKSYTVVVGKVNAAKLANFAEIDGWVVVGCWESSLLEDNEGKGGGGWWKPCVTPWELEAALGPEGGARMTGWSTDLESLLSKPSEQETGGENRADDGGDCIQAGQNDTDAGPLADEEESEPPQFDLRTGRYVSTSTPMRAPEQLSTKANSSSDTGGALTKRAKGDLAVMKGEPSPGAAYLRDKRTWRGLGSDFEIAYEEEQGGQIEEGRSGLARGYAEEI